MGDCYQDSLTYLTHISCLRATLLDSRKWAVC